MTRRIATAGILTAVALIFSYIESLIPFSFGVPGIKLGLANLVIVIGLYVLKLPEVCFIALIRILLSSLLFGNMMAFLYSLAGGFLSLVIMIILKKTNQFSVIGVSMAGGVFHNIGQILTAMITTGASVIAYYLPVLMGVGLLTGFLIGIIAGQILKMWNRFRINTLPDKNGVGVKND